MVLRNIPYVVVKDLIFLLFDCLCKVFCNYILQNDVYFERTFSLRLNFFIEKIEPLKCLNLVIWKWWHRFFQLKRHRVMTIIHLLDSGFHHI